jgi:hypothetical protein
MLDSSKAVPFASAGLPSSSSPERGLHISLSISPRTKNWPSNARSPQALGARRGAGPRRLDRPFLTFSKHATNEGALVVSNASRSLPGPVLATLALAGLGALAGCSTAVQPSAGGSPPVHRSDVTVTMPATTAGSAPASLAASTTAASPTAAAATAGGAQPRTGPVFASLTEACTPEGLLAFVRTQAGPPAGWQKVKIYNCVSGFARLYAAPNPDPAGRDVAGDQFFLEFTAGRWHVLDRGLGIDCGDNNPKLVEACAVFG